MTSKAAYDKFTSLKSVQKFVKFSKKYRDTLLSQPLLVPQLALNEGLITEENNQAKRPPYLMLSPLKDNLLTNTQSFSDITACTIESSDNISHQHLLMAQGFADASITLSLVRSGTPLFSLFGHASPITALTFISANKNTGDSYLASGSQDGFLSFWDLNARIRLKQFKAHSQRISALASSSDGLTLVSLGWDGLCKIWSGRSHHEISSLKLNASPFNCAAYFPGKDSIVTGDWEGTLKVFDLTTSKMDKVLLSGKGSIQDVQISGQFIACVDIGGLVNIFEGLFI